MDINWKEVKYLSVHDASPKFQGELEIIFDELKNVDVRNKYIAIVPNWGHNWDIRDYPKFINLMKEKQKRGWELVLHGYAHSHLEYVPWYNIFLGLEESWEFHSLGYDETKELALKAMNIFRATFGYKPKGFIAPNWRLSYKGYKAIKDLGFTYTTSLRHIKFFNKKWKKLWIYDPFFFGESKLSIISEPVLRHISNMDRIIIHPQIFNLK